MTREVESRTIYDKVTRAGVMKRVYENGIIPMSITGYDQRAKVTKVMQGRQCHRKGDEVLGRRIQHEPTGRQVLRR